MIKKYISTMAAAVLAVTTFASCSEKNTELSPEKANIKTIAGLSDEGKQCIASRIDIPEDMIFERMEFTDEKIYIYGEELIETSQTEIKSCNIKTGEVFSFAPENLSSFSPVAGNGELVYFLTEDDEYTYKKIICTDRKGNIISQSDKIYECSNFLEIYDGGICTITSDFSLYVFDDVLNLKACIDLSDYIYTELGGNEEFHIFINNYTVIGDDIYFGLTKNYIDAAKIECYAVKCNIDSGIEYIWENPGDLASDSFLIKKLPENKIALSAVNESEYNIDVLDTDTYEITDRYEAPYFEETSPSYDGYDIYIYENKLHVIDPRTGAFEKSVALPEGFSSYDQKISYELYKYGDTVYYKNYKSDRNGKVMYVVDFDGKITDVFYDNEAVNTEEEEYTLEKISEGKYRIINHAASGIVNKPVDISVDDDITDLGMWYASENYYLLFGYIGNNKNISPLYDKSGKFIRNFDAGDTIFIKSYMAETSDGFFGYYSDGCSLMRKNIAKDEEDEKVYEFSDNINYISEGDDVYTKYILTDDAFYGYDANENKIVCILKELRNLGITNIYEVHCNIADNRAFLNSSQGMYVLEITDNVPEKKYINIAFLPETDTFIMDINNKIKEHNMSNKSTESVIRVKQYNNYDDFNLDISSGKIPDIIISDDGYRKLLLAEQGMFADLGEIMDSDKDFSRSDYLENMLSLYKVDEKIYQISPYFSISTLIAKKSDLDSMTKWDYQNFSDVIKKYGDRAMYQGESKTDILIAFLPCFIDDFTDMEKGKCDIDTQYLKMLLEMINSQACHKDYDKTISCPERGIFFKSMNSCMEYGILSENSDEELIISGFPSRSGSVSYPEAEVCFSITESSGNKKESWEFIRGFFEDDVQSTMVTADNMCFPVMKTVYEEKLKNESKSECFKEAADEIDTIVKSFNKPVYHIEPLEMLIAEEAEKYFSGEVSSDEAVRTIQTKLSLFVSERY